MDRPLRILHLEDDVNDAELVQATLAGEGVECELVRVDTRAGFEEALQRGGFNLILSDYVLPSFDGGTAQEIVHERYPDLPFIFVSGNFGEEAAIERLKAGATDYVLKHRLEKLPAVVRRALREAEERIERRRAEEEIRKLNAELEQRVIERTAQLVTANEALTRREAELREAKAFLEHLVAASPSMIFRLDPKDLRATYVSPNIGWLLGYAPEEILGVPRFWQELVHPEDREVVLASLRAALETKATQVAQECRALCKDGRYRWFFSLMRIEYDEDAHPEAILGYALDIGDRKRAEEEFRRGESFLNSIVENLPSTVFVKDARDLRYVRYNRAGEDLVGYSKAEILGKTDYELFGHEADSFVAQDREVLRGNKLMDIPEEPIQSRVRGTRILHTKKIPILDEEGRPEYLLGISEDITERKVAEDSVKMARMEAERANRAKSEFLSRMSHDLRTPLNAILGFAQLLEMDDLSAEQRESVGHILRAGRHLLELLNEVLDIARIESGRLSLSPEPVAVSDIVKNALDIVRPLAAQRRIELDADPGRTCDRHVLADRQRLNQILLNLLSNAIKYNREGGRVTISCEEVPAQRFRIKVTDTGAGIGPEKLVLLFNPFERLGAEQSGIEGTGLGLALSKGLAEAMGGKIDVESEVDRGSTFWVELALANAVTEETKGGETRVLAADDAPEVSGTVLYVEDNTSNLRLIERLLKRRPGVKLLSATQGQQGVAMARERRPNLIFLDLHLPDIPGEEVLRQLWEDVRTRDIPVAVLSADATVSQTRRLLAAGATAYLTKPLDIGRLLKLLDDTLSSRRPERLPEKR